MKKRILALLLSLCMLLTLLPAGALATESAGTVTGTDGVAVAEEGYAIKVDSQTVDFGTVMRTTVASKEIVLTNTGSVFLKVALPESEFFTLDWEYYGSEAILDPGASVTVTIAPQKGLQLGTYEERITITGADLSYNETSVEITVKMRLVENVVTADGVDLAYEDTPVYAKTDEQGTVTLLPEEDGTGDWNLKLEGTTLTLRDANIRNDSGSGLEFYGDLTIQLEESNTITGVAGEESAGIYGDPNKVADNTTITFAGSGSLTVDGGIYGMRSNMVVEGGQIEVDGAAYAIYLRDLTVHSGQLKGVAEGFEYGTSGISVFDLTVTGGEIIGIGGTIAKTDGYAADSIGIECWDLTVEGGIVTGIGGKNEHEYGRSEGIQIVETSVISGAETKVTGIAGEASEGYGIRGNNQGNQITLSGGQVEAVSNCSKRNYGIDMDYYTVAPAEGEALLVLTGQDRSTMNTIEGSPFTSQREITVPQAAYFYSCAVQAGATYTVSFDGNGGGGSMAQDDAAEVQYTLPACSLTPPTRMEFDAWAMGSPEGQRYEAGAICVLTGDTTFYALWKELPVYEISVSPEEIDFGSCVQNGYLPKPETVMITNTGNQTITLGVYIDTDTYQLEWGEEFAETGRVTLEPGGTASFTVRINPDEVRLGENLGTIYIEGSEVYEAIDIQVLLKESAETVVEANGKTLSWVDEPVYAKTDDQGIVTLLPEEDGTGEWNLKLEGTTLTLRDATVSGSGVVVNKGITLELEGDSKITMESPPEDGSICPAALYVVGSLTIQGNGSLEATGPSEAISSFGIYAEYDIDIRGGTVTGTGGVVSGTDSWSVGIYNGDDLLISGGIVTATGGEASGTDSWSVGLDSGDMMEISGGTVKATGDVVSGEESWSTGIYSGYDLLISGGTVTATADTVTGENGESIGLYGWYDIDITGGTVTATGGEASGAGSSMGIYCDEFITVSDGTVTATGGEASDEGGNSFGIDAYELLISGGTVTATAGAAETKSAGIQVNGTIEISGAGTEVTASSAAASDEIEGDSIGIQGGAVLISGGTVTATAGTAVERHGVYGETGVVVSPATGAPIAVQVGADVESAEEMEGSPFSEEEAIEVQGKAYFHSKATSILSLTPEGVSFPTVIEGYGAITPETLTLKNTGSVTVEGLTAQLTGTQAESFTLDTGKMAGSLAPEEETSFTVAPKTGLPAGSYTARVDVRENGKSINIIEVTIIVEEEEWENPFTDVEEGYWYYEAIEYVNREELMNGVSETIFRPNGTLTRAQVAQILYNMEGRPTVTGENSFKDVKEGLWYYTPIVWAAETGVVNGTSPDEYSPERAITREQLAVMLYRYAEYKGLDTSAKGRLEGFTDSGNVSSWAEEALSWAVGAGIISGKGERLDPLGGATRAEAATMLMRFSKNVG